MTIDLVMEFNTSHDEYSRFITDYHASIVGHIGRYHKGLGVVGPELDDEEWRWSRIRITNHMQVSIDLATSLESLWVFGIRRVLPGDVIDDSNPWMLVSDYKNQPGFSGLDGHLATMDFSGSYGEYVPELNVSRSSLNNAIYAMDRYAEAKSNSLIPNPNPEETKRAERSFILLVLYFAEALRILPMQNVIKTGFNLDKNVVPGLQNVSLAKNWETISNAFFWGDYSRVGTLCLDEERAKQILGLLLHKKGKHHVLDGRRSDQPDDEEAEGEGDNPGGPDDDIGGNMGGHPGGLGGDGVPGVQIGNLHSGSHVGGGQIIQSQGVYFDVFKLKNIHLRGVAIKCTCYLFKLMAEDIWYEYRGYSVKELYLKKKFNRNNTPAYTCQLLTDQLDRSCSNILLDDKGVVKYADFHFAQQIEGNKAVPRKEEMDEWIRWAAPEILMPEDALDVPAGEVRRFLRMLLLEGPHCGPAIDIWSLRCAVLEMGWGAVAKIYEGKLPALSDALPTTRCSPRSQD